jgi:hypothetical protein
MDTWQRRVRRVALCLLASLVVACGSADAPASTGAGAASTFEEYTAGACSALQSLWRAYGNPDTAGLSPMMHAFVDAVERGDVVAAGTTAAAVRAELERGRASAAVAAGWPQGTQSMVHMDRLLRAMEALVEARRDATPLGNLEATNRGQAAFEAAGGRDAWFGMLTGIDAAANSAGESWPKCEGVPIG